MRIAHAGRRTPRPGERVRSQAGETLIEVLVAITLMGIGFSAVIGGIYTAVRLAETNQRYTKASISVQAFAESLQQPARDIPAGATPSQIANSVSLYRPCATPETPSDPGTYNIHGLGAPAYTVPTGWSAKIIKIEYFTNFSSPLTGLQQANWDENTAACMARPSYATPPPGDVSRDGGMQRLTIEVTNNDPDRPVTDTLVIVKRDRRCPPASAYNNADLGPC